MTKPIVFMFSGQGSHYYQMGRKLFEQQPIFRHWMQLGDAIFLKKTGSSLLTELYSEAHKKSDLFSRTLFTHPAIFLVEYSLAKILLAQGIIPDYALGSSLGEFAAASIAGILTFEDALDAVIAQAQILKANSEQGSMIAILEPPNFYHDNAFVHENSELAAINFHSHFIVSGEAHCLKKIAELLKEQQITFQTLAVTHGFHSSSIDTSAIAYSNFLTQMRLQKPILPFVSCAHANSLTALHAGHFWDAIRLPIKFQTTIQALESKSTYHYLDVGPSGTLATFIKYNLAANSSSTASAVLTPYGEDLINLTKLTELLAS